MKKRPNYIVYAPAFDPDSGGAIFLHELVHALNQNGERAFLWPWSVPRHKPVAKWLWKVLQRPSLLWKSPIFSVRENGNTPLAKKRDLRTDSIVVYPEVTLGNPLSSRRVVRWLLYRPGLRDPFSFGPDEMFFRAGKMCDMPELTGGAPDLFTWKINPAYRNAGRTDRSGACFIVRKGSDKPRIPQTADAIQIDGKSHGEIAEIFNRCEVFYSYDEATLYSQYAAICGCTSVIIPGLFKNRDEWVQNHEIGRFGIAYGVDDIEHAVATRGKTIELLREKERLASKTVTQFIDLTQNHFGDNI